MPHAALPPLAVEALAVMKASTEMTVSENAESAAH